MNEKREKAKKQILVGVLLLLIAGASYFFGGNKHTSAVTSFTGCVEAGYPVMESYPRQCRTPEGTLFREDIGNELEKDELIRISEPRPNGVVTSPLTVKGMARGTWFFEASFPVRLFDGNGEMIARGIAQAKEDWMTTEFVSFEASLSFTMPTSTTGTLLLERDNPSGLPENEDALRLPIRFDRASSVPPPVVGTCVVSGCSGQICAEEEMVSTCEFKEEYACYKKATCERQAGGRCGWTDTGTLRACIAGARQ